MLPPLIRLELKSPTGVKCVVYFKTVKEGQQFSNWLEATLEAAAEKGRAEG